MDWDRDGRDWPNRDASRFVDSAPHRWHVQRAGQGPVVLLLHGAGGSSHSWRDVLPALAVDHHVIAVDLPGQGFTKLGSRSRCGLAGMAEDLLTLMTALGTEPDAIVGHSAGGPIAAQMALFAVERGASPPAAIVAFNGAFAPFQGVAGVILPAAAKLLALNPFAGPAIARLIGSEAGARSFLKSTGSVIDAKGVALYKKLVSDASHVEATIAMMAQWRLNSLLEAAPRLKTPLLLIAGERDGVVPPQVSRDFADVPPNASFRLDKGRGHLSHEEAPEEAAEAVRAHLSRARSDHARRAG